MTPGQFITELEQIFNKQLNPRQTPLYVEKLRRFTSSQLLEILNKVLEEQKFFPKVSEIFKVASELGYLSIDTCSFERHHWTEDECNYCHGEGRLAIIWQFWLEPRNSGMVEVQRITKVIQYSKSLDDALPDNHFRSLFRCQCDAGNVGTLPKNWPKFSSVTPVQREVWL